MKILIVDDQQGKVEQLTRCIRESYAEAEIMHATNAHDGFLLLTASGANLVLLDVVLPLNAGAEADEAGSLWFIREVKRKVTGAALPFIVGTTQYAESFSRVEETFRHELWSIVYIGASEERWPQQIKQAVRFARSNAERVSLGRHKREGHFDIAIVAALRTPEYSELVNALGGGEQVRLDETNELWLKSKLLRTDGSEISVLAACADDMGMTSMASLVTKVGIACNPKKLFLVGIMAGNPARVGLTDLVIAEGTWNFQSGKWSEDGFKPDVKSLPGCYKMANAVKNILTEEFIVKFWQDWKGGRPQQIAKVLPGEVACSPYVVADGKAFDRLEDEQKRKILGLEMEAYGCYDAARRLGDLAPAVLCIKSVCDFGDGAKGDDFQIYCSALSAAAVVHVLKDTRLFESL